MIEGIFSRSFAEIYGKILNNCNGLQKLYFSGPISLDFFFVEVFDCLFDISGYLLN